MLLVNPPPSKLGIEHSIFRGSARSYGAFAIDGALSVKTVRRGRALWRSGGREWIVQPGRYLVLNDERPYDIEIESIEPVETFCVFFQRGFADDVLRNAATGEEALLDDPLVLAERPFHETILPLDSRLEQRFDRLERIAASDADPTDDLATIVADLHSAERRLRGRAAGVDGARASTRRETLRRVLRGRDIIESEWDRPLPLEQIAQRAAMSPYHFHRRYREAFGMTPLEHLTRNRLDQARRLLEETDSTVLEICLEVGFESQPSFTRLFRTRFGLPPGRYRAEFRKIR